MDIVALWGLFAGLVLGTLFVDLLKFSKNPHVMSFREASAWCGIWVGLAASFGVAVFYLEGSAKGLEFVTGYIIEWSLSVDNLFVFIVIFRYFAVPPAFQHRVLFWGIMGAIVLRGIFIAAGVGLLTYFHWTIYLFGAFLVYTGVKLLRAGEVEVEPQKNPVLRFFKRLMPIETGYEKQSFFVRRNGQLVGTALVPVLIVIETTDVMFAVDSVPAILAITQDPFIVYTSNIFAILGLRALYFLLAGVMGMFRYLKVGLCFVLSFVGIKMLISDFYKIPITVSLGLVAGILAASIVISLLLPAKEEAASGDAGEAPAPTKLAEEFAPQESDLAIAAGKRQRGHQETKEEEKEYELV
jgi:tellurite resistance protein TerC